jgi:hypothetical protein
MAAVALFLAATGILPGQTVATNGLRIEGNGYISIPHFAGFNAYPFTVAFWMRTTNFNASVEPVVSKYFNGSFNGWSVHTLNGRVRAWFYRDGANNINPGGVGIDGGPIADGRWHHVAFVVDASGARLLVDGVVRVTAGWSGAAGVPTSGAPLHFGAIANHSIFYRGDIDEVSIWNQALDNAAVNYIKHRTLASREEGLVGYYRLDEGTGLTVTDSGPSARTGNFVGGISWIPSTAPIAFSPIAGSAAKFDGVDDQVSVAHAPDLNAYPLTVTAWFRTTRVAFNYDAIVNKYGSGSGNGWSLHLYNGRLAAFYFRDGANRVYTADPGFDGGFVADGAWHHVAYTIDASGGKIFVDGTQRGSLAWTGTPGPCTSNHPVLIGRYPTFGTFLGQIDEVTIWNRGLSSSEIQLRQNLPLVGNEPGLVAYWKFDEGASSVAVDWTGSGHTATLQNGAFWTGSLARLGDGSQRVAGNIDSGSYFRTFAIKDSPSQDRFPIFVGGSIRRFHDFGTAPPVASVSARITGIFRDAAQQDVPDGTAIITPANMVSENANAPATNSLRIFNTAPQMNPIQLDSVNGLYTARLALETSVDDGPYITNEVYNLPQARFMHFNGHLFFGNVDTIFTQVSNTPPRGLPTSGGISTVLTLVSNAGYVVGYPNHRYFLNSSYGATLFPDGRAVLADPGAMQVSAPYPDDTTFSNLILRRNYIVLRADGAHINFALVMPTGLGVGWTNTGILNPEWPFDPVLAGPDLLPIGNVLAENWQVYLVDETKPFHIGVNSINWNLNSGVVTFPAPITLNFIRQQVDGALATNDTRVVEAGTTRRISNDGYFQGITTANGPMTLRANSNGFALANLDLNLPATEFRPHFPYSPRNQAGIQSTGGRLVYTNRTIDIIQSALQVASAFPVTYARDCQETNCGGITTTGAAVLQFSANANQLNFTADGGLLANGIVPAQELTWGFAGGTNFAQRTSNVETGAYYMAGTFLRAENTILGDNVRPAVLLYSGFGAQTNSPYDERPGEIEYADGFANYAGVSFRAPAQARSYIANTLTAFYPLTPRSKYYARFGGVSGIHEAQTFAGNLNLYGYPFTFTSYRLSYLDSGNYQSRTDGQVVIPYPSQFTQEFAEMRFVCRGGLDSARVAASSGEKHLAYWNVDFTPQSVQFRGQKGDLCGAGPRTLVLGAETRLPFIPQRLHAALGFKSNGNLATVADNVEGCDSRFAVPSQLTLQGPNGGRFRLSTAGEGYFNSWTQGTTDPGFYNLVGKLDLPFFEDSKVHLHVVPITSSFADVFVMGGWRASDKEGTDYGWNIGGKTFFTLGKFDSTHRGYPSGVALADYRNSPTAAYHPRAQRAWLDIVKFDYGLVWNKATHRFASLEQSKVVLPVIDVISRLKDLTPGKIDIEFAQDINVGIPSLKLLDLANDGFDELNGPLLSVSNAVYQNLSVQAASLTKGFNSMQRVLRDQTEGFFRPAMDPVLTGVATTLYPLLTNALAVQADFLGQVSNIVAGSQSGLRTAASAINGATNNASSVFGQLNQALTDMDDTLGLFERIVAKDPNDNTRHVVRTIIQKIVKDQGPQLGLVIDTATGLADSVVNDLLVDLEPTLAEVEKQLGDVRRQLNEVRLQLGAATGQFKDTLNAISQNAQSLNNYVGFAGTAVSNWMALVYTPQKDFLSANRDAAIQQIKEQLFRAFLNSVMAGKYQQTFKQFLYDDNALVNQIMETLFQQINQSVRNGLQEQLLTAQDGAFKNFKGPGQMSSSLLAARIRGAPEFNGDSLRKIRLDANINLKLPDDMTFNAFLEVKELSSANTPVGCIPAGSASAEVTLGANEVPLGWAGIEGDPRVNVAARWTMQGGSVYGVGGSLGLNGGVDFKGVHIEALEAALALGEFESYFAARAAGSSKGGAYSLSADVGIFAGKACRPDPLKLADPHIEEVLPTFTDFSGIYLQYGGVFPLTQLIGIPPSCVLRADGVANYAFYYRGGPRLGTVGGRMKLGLDVELLCVIGGHIDYGAAIQASGSELSFTGSANVCAKVGVCPFCLEKCAGITIKGVVNDGGVDYFVDF